MGRMDGRKLFVFLLVLNRLGEGEQNSEGFLDKLELINVFFWGKEEKEGMRWGRFNWDNFILFGQIFEG